MLAGRTGRLEPHFTGTTIKHLTGKAVSALELPLPPIADQEEIARILRSLDDKIELNRRTNETLEAIARALFKSWFIDFDPVWRNAARAQNQPSPAASRLPLPKGEGKAAPAPFSVDSGHEITDSSIRSRLRSAALQVGSLKALAW